MSLDRVVTNDSTFSTLGYIICLQIKSQTSVANDLYRSAFPASGLKQKLLK